MGRRREKSIIQDGVLLQLLNLRTEFAVEVARLKEEEGLALRGAPDREQKVLVEYAELECRSARLR